MPRSRRVDPSTTLGAVSPGSAARLGDVAVDDATRLRLAEFGLRPGSVVRVVNRTPGGGCVVGLGTSRIAVDRRTARLVTVDSVDSISAVDSVETISAVDRVATVAG